MDELLGFTGDYSSDEDGLADSRGILNKPLSVSMVANFATRKEAPVRVDAGIASNAGTNAGIDGDATGQTVYHIADNNVARTSDGGIIAGDYDDSEQYGTASAELQSSLGRAKWQIWSEASIPWGTSLSVQSRESEGGGAVSPPRILTYCASITYYALRTVRPPSVCRPALRSSLQCSLWASTWCTRSSRQWNGKTLILLLGQQAAGW